MPHSGCADVFAVCASLRRKQKSEWPERKNFTLFKIQKQNQKAIQQIKIKHTFNTSAIKATVTATILSAAPLGLQIFISCS